MKKILFLLLFIPIVAFPQATGKVISDKPSGGSIGTAATTVDLYTTFNLNQTTAGQTLTIPNLTNTSSGKIIYVNNIGSVALILNPGGYLPVSRGVTLRWTGSVWNECSSMDLSVPTFTVTGGALVDGLTVGRGNRDTVSNTAVGFQTLSSNTTGTYNSGVGWNALQHNTTGYVNTSVGAEALRANTSGYSNCAFGVDALFVNTTGNNNSSYGFTALYRNTTGGSNTSIGSGTLRNNISGSRNTVLGSYAGYRTTGSDNIFLGSYAGYSETGSNKLYIGSNDTSGATIYGDLATKTVGINTITPDSSSILDLNSTNKGFLPPRMTTTQRNTISSPANGLMIYNSTTDTYNGYQGGSWSAIGSNIASGNLTSTGSYTLNLNSNSLAITAGKVTFKGYGSTSGTTCITGLNSSAESLFDIKDDGTFRIGVDASSADKYTTVIGYHAKSTSTGVSIGARAGELGSNAGINIGLTAGYHSNSSTAINIGNGANSSGIATGSECIWIGNNAGDNITSGSENIGIGRWALITSTTGSQNTSIGTYSGRYTTGSGSVFLGYGAGMYETSGNRFYVANTYYDDQATERAKSMMYGVFNADPALQVLNINAMLSIAPMTATQASAITPSEGNIVMVSSTNGTFTSIGFWGYYNGAWHAF